MSFFDRQGISEALIRSRSGTRNSYKNSGANGRNSGESSDKNSVSEASVDDGFEDDILTLRNYSFVFLSIGAATFEIYRLV
jgi:hypothetical protein